MTRRTGLLVALAASLCTASRVEAAACQAEDFAAIVDQSGAALRTFTLEVQPRLQEKLRHYKTVRKLSEEEYQDVAFEAIQDSKLAELDQTSGDLLLKVDTLGRVPDGGVPDCGKLDEIKAASSALLSVMKAKSDYIMQRLDTKIAEATSSAVTSTPEASPPAAHKPKLDAKSASANPPPPNVKSVPPASASPDWSSTTKADDAYSPPQSSTTDGGAPPALTGGEPEGYTIDEIREATRGFFGGLSTNLASVIEHAFKESGRPTAYVLGTEGGGAFLAGLRFGEGTLFMRLRQHSMPVYWHGPSLGSDFGASGSRTLFLIYNLHDADALFRNFAGVDGSAYVVGGVGLTVLKGGDIIMAPIRTGLGLRVGASVGYIRFTRHGTWNPF